MATEQKAVFYNLLEQAIKSLKPIKRETFSITQEKYKRVLSALQLPKGAKCPDGAHFKFWSNKHFKVHNIGTTKVLYCQKTSVPLVTKEEMFDTIKRCHERVGHSGRSRTWDEIRNNYGWIKHDVVSIFLKTCSACTVRQPLKQPPSKKPMISLGFLTRVQMDLIDMRSRPDGDYKWILHMRDHFTKFSWTHPLETKQASSVAQRLLQTFCLFGCPRILQSDNGREFVNDVIDELCAAWPGMVIIHGRPRHPQSQGCVERANGDLQKKLGKWLEEHPGRGWSEGLPFITYAMNTSTSSTTSKPAYEVVFAQPPRTECSLLELLEHEGLLDEDDIPEDYFEQEAESRTPLELELSADDDPLPSTSAQPVKRGNEHELLYSGTVVATGTEILHQKTVHGVTVDNHEGVFQVTSVLVPEHVPVRGNPFEEPLTEGQFVLWKLEDTSSVTHPDTPHSKVRKIATASYLKSARKQQAQHDKTVSSCRKYQVGDVVGVPIHEADRTNTDARILPCKVSEVNESGVYKLYCSYGILRDSFQGDQLSDISSSSFPALDEADPSSLDEITLIQACRQYNNWNSQSVCKCKGSCVTNKCRCKRAGLKCSTKCHTSTVGVCQNCV